MSIGEVARELDLSIDTLRYYEKIGLLKNINKINGKREYTDENINCITDDVFITIGILYYSNSYKIYRTKSLIHYNAKSDTEHNSKTSWKQNNEQTKFYRIDNLEY